MDSDPTEPHSNTLQSPKQAIGQRNDNECLNGSKKGLKYVVFRWKTHDCTTRE